MSKNLIQQVKSIFDAHPGAGVDHAVDVFLTSQLKRIYPEAFIVSEEVTGKRVLDFQKNPFVLCIDPIDGSSLIPTGSDFGPMWSYFQVSEKGEVFPIETVIHHMSTGETILISGSDIQGTKVPCHKNEQISIADGRSLREYSQLKCHFNKNKPQNGVSIVSTSFRIYHYEVDKILLTEGEIWDIIPVYALLKALNYKITNENINEWRITSHSIPVLFGQIK